MNFGLDLDDGVNEEADDARLVGTHRVVHSGDLVAGVVFDPGQEMRLNSTEQN